MTYNHPRRNLRVVNTRDSSISKNKTDGSLLSVIHVANSN